MLPRQTSASGSPPSRRNRSIRLTDRCGRRCCACRTTTGCWPFCLLHHLVIDDWSPAFLEREFSRFYRARRQPDTSAVRRFARAARTTPFTVLTAAAVALLHRHGTGDDIVVGTPVSRRGNAGLDSVMGCLTALMPPRFTVGADLSFRDLVRSTRSEVLDLVRHRDVPSGELILRTATAGQLGRFPLFQTVAQVNDSPSPG
ncbi:condensation domain-containing protein [Streptomyces anulatus]